MAKIADIVFPAVLLMLALPSQPYRLEKPWSGPEFAPFVGKCSTVVANASDVQTRGHSARCLQDGVRSDAKHNDMELPAAVDIHVQRRSVGTAIRQRDSDRKCHITMLHFTKPKGVFICLCQRDE
eukprot:m.116761 g.116761  ORF g.116761 m.116761 type:complete len:125 (+) comp37586_c0_seq4:112-486(+)